jgi:C4-dicarboxylate-specific signal transduction histidine kinase
MELAHANRVSTMGQLTASIAHELKQPMAAARTEASAALRWLDKTPPDLAEVRDALAGIVSATDRAGNVVNRIRGLMRKAPPTAQVESVLRKFVASTPPTSRDMGTDRHRKFAHPPMADLRRSQPQLSRLPTCVLFAPRAGGLHKLAQKGHVSRS